MRNSRLLFAPLIFSPKEWLTNHVLEIDHQGTVLDLRPRLPQDQPEEFSGALCPGWVNAHCHLELSMLKGIIPEGIGMVPFVSEVVGKRQNFSIEEIQASAQAALEHLEETGTRLLGDICNTDITAEIKWQSNRVLTHSFIELLGLVPAKAEAITKAGRELLKRFEGLSASLTLHAPYSVSEPLRNTIYANPGKVLSIHLLESAAEVELFATGKGPFLDFFSGLGIEFSPFEASHPTAHVLQGLPQDQQVLWVHNRLMGESLMLEVALNYPNAFFCLCPRSNQYLHGSLPPAEQFLQVTDRVCLGTDSLASNHSLDIWEEVKCLNGHFPQIELHTLIKWSTYNGAKALGNLQEAGRFIRGARPGILHLNGINQDLRQLTTESSVEPLG
ncbi:MAG: amidohydrolase family protein [Bacteroidota bacterium]